MFLDCGISSQTSQHGMRFQNRERSADSSMLILGGVVAEVERDGSTPCFDRINRMDRIKRMKLKWQNTEPLRPENFTRKRGGTENGWKIRCLALENVAAIGPRRTQPCSDCIVKNY